MGPHRYISLDDHSATALRLASGRGSHGNSGVDSAESQHTTMEKVAEAYPNAPPQRPENHDQ